MTHPFKSALTGHVSVSESFAGTIGAAAVVSNYNDFRTIDVVDLDDVFDEDHDDKRIIWSPLSTMSNSETYEVASNIKDQVKQELTSYAEAIKLGLIIQTIRMQLDGDFNALDMDTLARIGINTDIPQIINGSRAIFDMETCTWLDAVGNSYEMSDVDGTPIAG